MRVGGCARNHSFRAGDDLTAEIPAARLAYGGQLPRQALGGGGAEYSSLPYTPVWNSDDGVSWTPVTTFGDGPYRLRSQLVEFNNRLYLIGGEGSRFGYVDDFYRDDVWSTADGITWTETTPDAPWSGRWDHSAFVFNAAVDCEWRGVSVLRRWR
jgi:hypothetical protein